MIRMEEVRDGMTVRTNDGEKLGKILSVASGHLLVEKGLFFPKDYHVPIDLVSDVRDDEIWLSCSKEELKGRSEAYESSGQTTTAGAFAGERYEGTRASGSEEQRMQLSEEELEARKHQREAGEVRVRKEVVTDKRTIEVPVTREEVHVEHVAASGTAEPGREAFEEKTISVPVREEEVEVVKRPRVREEIRISKTAHQEERRVEGEVRREQARVERTDDKTGLGEPEE